MKVKTGNGYFSLMICVRCADGIEYRCCGDGDNAGDHIIGVIIDVIISIDSSSYINYNESCKKSYTETTRSVFRRNNNAVG